MDIHGLQKLTLLDYPGRTACTVFLAGCNLRCPFCHNSELLDLHTAEPVMTDAELLNKAIEVCPSLMKVTCASADKFVDAAEDKLRLHELYGGDICEMEAAGVVLTCARNKVPCLLIKAVSDSLVGGGKEFLTELNRVSVICFDVVDKIVQSL